jgi:AraC-like DNA-binding protein
LLARARAVTLWHYPDLARCLGADPYAILDRSGIQASALNDPENWLPGKQILNVLEETARATGRDDLGVLLGETRSFASLGPVSLLLKHETRLRDVITSMTHYRRLINELLTLKLEEHGAETLVHWSLIPGLRSSQGVNLMATIAYRVLVDGTAINWVPECLHFRHAAPVNRAAFHRVFRCRLEFDSEFDGLSFRSEYLDRENIFGDAELAAHARSLLDLLPGVRRTESTAERAKGTIAILLPKGEANSENVARSLGLSTRNLHRRLGAEGETFGGLLKAVRRELVARQLKDSSHSITAIAELSGFSAVSAFTRWFTAQFGMPPREWRRAQANGEARAYASDHWSGD